MQVKYKDQEPQFQSEFLDDITSGQDSYSVTFLGNYMEPTISTKGPIPVDLYFVQYQDGLINTVYQFGDEPSDYGSGSVLAYRGLLQGNNNGYTEVYRRAVKEGLIKEKTSFVGFSEILDEKEQEEYFNSDYFLNRPDREFHFENTSYDELSDDEYDKLENKLEVELEEYRKNYIKEHGSLPKRELGINYHIFESLEQARELCPPGQGYFKKITYSSDEHLAEIVRNENFNHKIQQQKLSIDKEAQEPSI
jgi:hypothetical protein